MNSDDAGSLDCKMNTLLQIVEMRIFTDAIWNLIKQLDRCPIQCCCAAQRLLLQPSRRCGEPSTPPTFHQPRLQYARTRPYGCSTRFFGTISPINILRGTESDKVHPSRVYSDIPGSGHANARHKHAMSTSMQVDCRREPSAASRELARMLACSNLSHTCLAAMQFESHCTRRLAV